MGYIKNTMDLVKKGEKCANPLYAMTIKNVNDIIDSSTAVLDSANNFFHFGYMQGMKAAKAEMKRKEHGI